MPKAARVSGAQASAPLSRDATKIRTRKVSRTRLKAVGLTFHSKDCHPPHRRLAPEGGVHRHHMGDDPAPVLDRQAGGGRGCLKAHPGARYVIHRSTTRLVSWRSGQVVSVDEIDYAARNQGDGEPGGVPNRNGDKCCCESSRTQEPGNRSATRNVSNT